MNKIILTTIAGLAFTCFSFVASTEDNSQKDKAATKLLKEVSKKYKGYKTIKAEFTLTSEAADPKAVKKSDKGTLWSKGNNFKLVFLGQEIYCNGKYIWTYTPSVSECQKEDYDANASNSINPAKLFNIWEKGFLYKSDGTGKTKSGAETSKVTLTPTDKSKPYFLMNLEVHKKNKTVESLKVSFKAGNKQTYTVDSQTPNASIDDKTFTFDPSKYPGVEIIDLTKH
jgi:outer membrane lipoprotein carrier protein